MTTATNNEILAQSQQLADILTQYVYRTWNIEEGTPMHRVMLDEEDRAWAMVYPEDSQESIDGFGLYWDENEGESGEFIFRYDFGGEDDMELYTAATTVDELTFEVIDEVASHALDIMHLD